MSIEHRNPLRALTLSVALATFAICPAFAGDAVKVKIDNFTFVPATITVASGTTVTWENVDDIPHSIVSPANKLHSKPLDTGDTFSFTFNDAGEFSYVCGLHPHMMGKVVVTK